MVIALEVSPGELLDRITILEIKTERITTEPQSAILRRELEALVTRREGALPRSQALDALTGHLKKANVTLWGLEDEIRDCERHGTFGARFVEIARAIYRTNDRRSAIKGQINELFGSTAGEVKSYERY